MGNMAFKASKSSGRSSVEALCPYMRGGAPGAGRRHAVCAVPAASGP